MIIVFKGADGQFHLVRSISQEGLGIAVEGYCGCGGGKTVQQLPKEFMGKLHEGCISAFEKVKGQA